MGLLRRDAKDRMDFGENLMRFHAESLASRGIVDGFVFLCQLSCHVTVNDSSFSLNLLNLFF